MVAPHLTPNSAPDPACALAEAKREARLLAAAARAGCDPAWGMRLAGHVLDQAAPPPGAVVSGFWPLPGELDLRPLLLALIGRGHQVVLPVTPRRGLPLSFRLWRPGAPLLAGRFGTCHPQGAELAPDFLLVPLLAFDRSGRRLGYGAGYYDRTIAGLPGATLLGCAFAAQEMAAVPAGPHDRTLPRIATERGVIRCRGH